MNVILFMCVFVSSADPMPAWRATLPPGLSASGAGGCSASGCHGGNAFRGTAGSEFSTWAAHDPHARAFAVLFDDRSSRMIRLLCGPDALATERGYLRALESENCLHCHATSPRADSPILADGVGCEACHGPSERYRAAHYLSGWKSKSWQSKCAEGLAPLGDAAARAVACAKCHVGAAGQDVNHDLIAAGHPRLVFEYASHMARYPKHWNKPADEVRDWVVGQAAAGRASAELLQARAVRANPWPELAEFGCYSCHHELTGQVHWRQERPADRVGALTWGEWSAFDALAKFGRDLAPDVDWKPATHERLRRQIASDPPAAVADTARQRRLELETALDRLSRPGAVRPGSGRDLARRLAHDGQRPAAFADWESAAHHYLALAALTRSDGLKPLRRPLLFETVPGRRYDSPRRFTREDYVRALTELLPLLE